jgi:hypothetical protein
MDRIREAAPPKFDSVAPDVEGTSCLRCLAKARRSASRRDGAGAGAV